MYGGDWVSFSGDLFAAACSFHVLRDWCLKNIGAEESFLLLISTLTPPLSRRERAQQHSPGFVINTLSLWERGGVRGRKQNTLEQGSMMYQEFVTV